MKRIPGFTAESSTGPASRTYRGRFDVYAEGSQLDHGVAATALSNAETAAGTIVAAEPIEAFDDGGLVDEVLADGDHALEDALDDGDHALEEALADGDDALQDALDDDADFGGHLDGPDDDLTEDDEGEEPSSVWADEAEVHADDDEET